MRPTFVGLLLGTIAGLALVAWQPGLASRRGCGVVILLCVAITLTVPKLRPSGPLLAGTGVVSGVMGAISAVHGPLIGLVVAPLPVRAVRGFLGAFYLFANLSLLLLALPAGRAEVATLPLTLALVPGLLLGALAARPARRWLVGPRVRMAILVVATLAGGLLVIVG